MPSSNNKPSENNNSTNNIEDLSPDTLALLARAKKRFIFSMSLLFLGIAAVIFAVIIRSDDVKKPLNENLGENYSAGVLVVPANAKIISATPSDGLIAITYEIEGKIKLRLLNGATGAIIRDIDFVTQ